MSAARAPVSDIATAPLLKNGQIADLARRPEAGMRGEYLGTGFSTRVAIPNMRARVGEHYADQLGAMCPRVLAEHLSTTLPFEHFGLVLRFDAPSTLDIFDTSMRLRDDFRAAIDAFGAISLRNVRVADTGVNAPQTNIFSHLKFHFDRGDNQPERYSLFLRDPKSQIQRPPRESSTVIVANLVAYLQALKETGCEATAKATLRASRKLFQGEDINPLTETFMIEQRWDESEGTAETVILDNRTVLHASYYRDAKTAGYPIGVRYLL